MMETAAFGLHDAILLCTGVAAVYLVVAVLQLMRLKHHRTTVTVAREEPSVRSQLLLEADASSPDDLLFFTQLRRSSIESDLKQLNLEVGRLHTALQAMRFEVEMLRNERVTSMEARPCNDDMKHAGRDLGPDGAASLYDITIGGRTGGRACARPQIMRQHRG